MKGEERICAKLFVRKFYLQCNFGAVRLFGATGIHLHFRHSIIFRYCSLFLTHSFRSVHFQQNFSSHLKRSWIRAIISTWSPSTARKNPTKCINSVYGVVTRSFQSPPHHCRHMSLHLPLPDDILQYIDRFIDKRVTLHWPTYYELHWYCPRPTSYWPCFLQCALSGGLWLRTFPFGWRIFVKQIEPGLLLRYKWCYGYGC